MSNILNEGEIEEDNQRDVVDESETFDDSMLSEKNLEENESQPLPLTFKPDTYKKKVSIDSKITKKVKQSDALVEVLNKRSQEWNRLMEELTKIEDDDPIDVFFKSMSLTVKQFSPELKVRAKLDILRIVSELELKNNQQREIMSAPQVTTQPSTSYEFPKVMRLCPTDNKFENPYTEISNYSSSTSIDGEYRENSVEYWSHSLNK